MISENLSTRALYAQRELNAKQSYTQLERLAQELNRIKNIIVALSILNIVASLIIISTML